MEGVSVGETVQIIAQWSTNFTITPEMLYIDEEAAQKPLKEIETLDLVLPKILTKALYKLQISVTQKIQFRERLDAENLYIPHEDNISL
jgi:hypothetical protein